MTWSTRCRALVDELRAAGVRAELDDKTGGSLGRRVTDWELKGVPLRLEVGPRDLAENAATLAFRISGRAKSSVALTAVVDTVRAELEAEQAALLARGDRPPRVAHGRRRHARRRSRRAPRPVGHACRGRPSAPTAKPSSRQSGVTVRCLVRADGSLPDDDQEPDLVAYVARAY